MTITFSPTSPVADEVVTLASSAAGGSTTRWRLTTAPASSALATGFLQAPDGTYLSTFTPDVAGEYGFTAYGYYRFNGRPRYAGDPAGESRDQLAGSESGTVHVCALADLPVRTATGEGATLRLTVRNETVVAAEFVEPTSEAARIATLTTAVVAALAALVDVETDELGTDPQSGANDLRGNYEAHRVHAGHYSDDTISVVGAVDAASNAAAIVLINELHDRITAHQKQARSSDGKHIHSQVLLDVVYARDDTAYLPVTGKAATLAGAYVLLCDIRIRVYERHRTLLNTHSTADSTNTLTTALPLDTVVAAYLDALVDPEPNAAAGEVEGAFDLSRMFGFTVTV